MLETLKLSKTLKSSRDDFNVLDNFNVSSIKTAIVTGKELQEEISRHNGVVKTYFFVNNPVILVKILFPDPKSDGNFDS